MITEQDVEKEVEDVLKNISSQIESELSIVVGGQVSSGKSSFLNALFSCKQSEPVFTVGAEAGITTEPKAYRELAENVIVWDTPGLNDLDEKNVKTTKDFLAKGHDLAILIVSGAADSGQKENYEVLKSSVPKGNMLVVLNKADSLSKANRETIISQWKEKLDLASSETIYCCSSRGYDPEDKIIDQYTQEETPISVDDFGIPRTVFGVDEITKDIAKKLEKINKDLLFLKSQQNKSKAALLAITAACVSAGIAAFFPGSGVTVTGIQVGAICGLYYIYTGTMLSKTQALAMLPAYATQAIGRNLFLWAKSIMPPTGYIDAAAVGIAVTLTVSMLLTVNYMLKNNLDLMDTAATKGIFGDFDSQLGKIVKGASKTDWANPDFWKKVISRLV
ncbi:50S ribosome-binding GTPase [Vibrio sp. Sgm 22]|uniref:GTPase n=1 Tax=unclassified Vibrio TaxID=2614977 RepID=UPI002248CE16|nr:MULTISPECIES: GTPase [unclassified Vibrio]MCX2760073.1 50S ribosome-binding GTPase [Vibrio sp. 14G-20]MCX2777061.1 50S ribosome-binding GTPase [Vibrio sp. Sgm 22]